MEFKFSRFCKLSKAHAKRRQMIARNADCLFIDGLPNVEDAILLKAEAMRIFRAINQ